MQRFSLYRVHKVHGRTEPRTRTHGTTAALLYPHRNALRGDNNQIIIYRKLGIFHVGLIFTEFATSLKSSKINKAKNKPYYMSSFRVLEIAKIGLSENLTHLPSVIFANFLMRKIGWYMVFSFNLGFFPVLYIICYQYYYSYSHLPVQKMFHCLPRNHWM